MYRPLMLHTTMFLGYVCKWLGTYFNTCMMVDQDQDQDSLLVKRRNDNHSPGGDIGALRLSCGTRE